MSSDCNEIKWEIHNRKVSGKLLNICSLNKHLNNPLAKESKEKLVLLTENESMEFYNLWDATKPLPALTEKFIALNAYFWKEGSFQINDLNCHPQIQTNK